MDVVALRALADNYVFVLDDALAGRAAVVDPAEASPVLDWVAARGRRLEAILVTHHHGDHIGGIRELLQVHPGAAVIAGAIDLGRVPAVTRAVADGDSIRVLDRDVRVLAVPGHTRGHVAYFFGDEAPPALFSGDTLFGGTIGNLFEGTPEEMFESVKKIRALPGATKIYCAHEYTRATMQESVALLPDSAAVRARMRQLAALPPDASTVPLTLAVEREVNPYLRWDDPELRKCMGARDELDLFRKLCAS